MVLVDRGLLTLDDKQLKAADPSAADRVRHPLEKAILQQYLLTGDKTDLHESGAVDTACEEYNRALRERGLLPDDIVDRARLRRFRSVTALLVGVAAIKLVLALMRGHHNVAILVVLAAAASMLAYRYPPTLTTRGRRLLADLKARLTPSSAGNDRTEGTSADAALLAAVFGLEALPNEFVHPAA
jgi:uncharacterized protein (TIGR04222 family)